MDVRIAEGSPLEFSGDWLVFGVHDGESVPQVLRDSASGESVDALVRKGELSAGVGDFHPLTGAAGFAAGRIGLFGLGKRAAFDAGSAFSVGFAVAKKLAGKPNRRVGIVVPESLSSPGMASAFVEGLVVGTEGPGLRKSDPGRHPFIELALFAAGGPTESILGRALVVSWSVNLARVLVNTPPTEKSPGLLAERMAEEARSAGLQVEIWGRDRLERERFGGLLGVAAGSPHDPAFVRFAYRGADGPVHSLVGKGVTFDSGGLTLKPSASMEDMKADMTGAAVVVSTMIAAARLQLPVNLVGVTPLTENMTGGGAMKLGDVLTIRNGKTVEVMNTDAEGRLILADALSYVTESEPARVIDFATLTGACVVALGTKMAGLFANDEAVAAEVLAASATTGEKLWRMPLADDYEDGLKSHVADMKNVGGKWGGAITAAKFLQRFVGQTPWAHLDIAGPSFSESDNATRDHGGTGCFVRTMVAYLEGLKSSAP